MIAANFVGDATRFFFDCADGEIGTVGTVAKILADPLGKAAAAFALRNMDEVMQNQFAIVPGVDANNERVTKTHASCVFGDDADAFRCFRQFRIFRERNPIDHQHSDSGAILHSGKNCIARVPRVQWITARENEFFLLLCPVISERK